jgi:hypothetical protein
MQSDTITTMTLTVGDDGNCLRPHSSSYSSYRLPTLRSRGAESISKTQRDNDLQLQSLIKPESTLPTPPHSKSSSDIPMAMAGSLSSQHEVVEAFKIAFKRQEVGTVQVNQFITCWAKRRAYTEQEYSGIGVEQFNELYDFLLQNRLKYHFQQFESRNWPRLHFPILDSTSMQISKRSSSTWHRNPMKLLYRASMLPCLRLWSPRRKCVGMNLIGFSLRTCLPVSRTTSTTEVSNLVRNS